MGNIVFYEAQGKLNVGQVMEQKDSHMQVKAQGSSLQKVKTKDVLLQANLNGVSAAQASELAGDIAAQVDLDLLWECAPEAAFDFVQVAREYFGEQASVIEQVAMWQALQSAPIYFGKKGKGQFTRQPYEQIQIALAAVAKKEERLRQQAAWVEQMIAGSAPSEILQARDAIMQKKNANDMTYKAAIQAAADLKLTLPELMLHIGAFRNAFELHRMTFLSEYYPRGIEQDEHTLPEPNLHLWTEMLAEGTASDTVVDDVAIFSIDDSATTEIDDAFSVRQIEDHVYRIGIHIAAPALSVTRDDVADQHAVSRMSTLYMPGEKVTMLPDHWVEAFSLDEGTIHPVVSIYTTFHTERAPSEAFTDVETRVERIRITENLRHDTPQMQLNAADLEGERADYPQAQHLKVLWQGVQKLSAIRDAVRGKPENNNRADFSYALDNPVGTVPAGDECITISQRMRGSPIDKIVSEWMIFANVQWACWLRDLRIPALFRTQSYIGVRTSTHAQAHLAMGVPAYMWATSPLRRYADWLNQMQLLAAVRYGVTAPMKAPFQPKEADLLSRMSQFDEKYRAYAGQQNTMERYWCLRWVAQRMNEGVFDTQAIVIRENVLRLADIPLYLNSMVPADMPLQSRVRVQLQDIDWVKLEVGVRVLGRIEGEPILDEAFEDLPEDEVIGAEVVGQMATEVDAELPAQISVETPIEKL